MDISLITGIYGGSSLPPEKAKGKMRQMDEGGKFERHIVAYVIPILT